MIGDSKGRERFILLFHPAETKIKRWFIVLLACLVLLGLSAWLPSGWERLTAPVALIGVFALMRITAALNRGLRFRWRSAAPVDKGKFSHLTFPSDNLRCVQL